MSVKMQIIWNSLPLLVIIIWQFLLKVIICSGVFHPPPANSISLDARWCRPVFISVLTLPTQSPHQVSQVKGSGPHGSPFTSPGCHLDFWLSESKPQFPWPLLRFDHLLEWLTELRGTFTYVYQFIMKGYRNIQLEEMGEGRLVWGISLRKSQGLWEICARNGGRRPDRFLIGNTFYDLAI